VALGQGDYVETGVLDKVRKWRRVKLLRGQACVPSSHIQESVVARASVPRVAQRGSVYCQLISCIGLIEH